MWERFCVNVHGICRDGYPEGSNHFCCFWDSLNEECTMVKSIQATADSQKLTSQLLQIRFAGEEALEKKIKAAEEESD